MSMVLGCYAVDTSLSFKIYSLSGLPLTSCLFISGMLSDTAQQVKCSFPVCSACFQDAAAFTLHVKRLVFFSIGLPLHIPWV